MDQMILTRGNQGWSIEEHLALMKQANISRSILSITSPGTYLKPGDLELCGKITRETNEELAHICEKEPDHFSFFASLPLPDVEGSLTEIDYALDHLGAKGFAILTNANGVYLGEPVLDDVFLKLSQRKATVLIHPTTCRLCSETEGEKAIESCPLPQYPRPMLEFFFDTARTVSHLILSRTVERCPGITFIIPHCGSVLPSIVERITSYSARIYKNNSISTDRVRHLFKTRFYFDLAGFPFPDQIHGIMRFTDSSRLLYGTDYPFLPAEAVVESANRNDDEVAKMFGVDEQVDIYSRNACSLLGFQE
jgi:predicted TIM-barrel fold metal-dependent hydrolase